MYAAYDDLGSGPIDFMIFSLPREIRCEHPHHIKYDRINCGGATKGTPPDIYEATALRELHLRSRPLFLQWPVQNFERSHATNLHLLHTG